MKPLRVVLVDDSEVFLEGARSRLEHQSVEVLAAARTIDDALRVTHQTQPDVVLVDLMLANESGLELARRLCERDGPPSPPVVLISTHAEEDIAELMLGSSAAGFLPKAELSAEAIERILDNAG